MDERRTTWTSEEAMSNLESLTRLDWSREDLPEGLGELLGTYEAAIPELTAELRRLRSRRSEQHERSEEENPEGEASTSGYEDLESLARRLGLEQR